ncbi:hypothetical protein GCM10009789_36380 [Kribbella sancticallisti]|uniref:Homeodomain-like domain-containing protein n=2 Tax=Kribbella sancticallisti TaxID=460087 RepID=A0ABP4PLK5_9ACTN
MAMRIQAATAAVLTVAACKVSWSSKTPATTSAGLTDEQAVAGRPPRTGRQHMLTQLGRQHMLTAMETTVEIAEGAASNDPEVGLRAVAALRALTEQLEHLQVDNARALGWSWQDIATRLGVTKQTVHRKHGRRVGSR